MVRLVNPGRVLAALITADTYDVSSNGSLQDVILLGSRDW